MDADGNVYLVLGVKNKLYAEVFVKMMKEKVGRKFKVVFNENRHSRK